MPPAPLDTRIEIVTPENIALKYRVAGPFRRLPAYLIDLTIRLAAILITLILLIFVFGIVGLGGVGVGITLVAALLLEWFYGGLFETFWNGQTPGKRLLRIRVLSMDGQPIGGLQAVVRNVLRAVDAMPVFLVQLPTYQLGLLTTAMNNRYQRLGDLAAGTMVVVEEPSYRYGVIRFKELEVLLLAEKIPAHFTANRSLGLALSSYVLRRGGLPWSRRYEIARHLAEPLQARFALPAETNPDLLLCAVYHRVFFAAETAEQRPAWAVLPAAGDGALGGNPFGSSQPA